jgi:hypothetical protein
MALIGRISIQITVSRRSIAQMHAGEQRRETSRGERVRVRNGHSDESVRESSI